MPCLRKRLTGLDRRLPDLTDFVCPSRALCALFVPYEPVSRPSVMSMI
jgi:hypothetical protein